jgi:pilus assembly protein CpaB
LKRRLLTIVLAAVLAVFGMVAVLAYARQANVRAVNGLKAETVMVAKAAIPAGTSLRDAQQADRLTTETVPVSSLSAKPVQSITAANAHLVMSATVATGQLLLQNMLVPASSVVSSNSFVIPKGMVAVTVQMCVSEAVAGYLTAGSDVMVYGTVPTSQKVTVQRSCNQDHSAVPFGGATTAVVLQKVLVLSVAQAPAGAQGASSASSSALADAANSSLSSGTVSVTFAVTPGAEADQLIQVAQVELPYLALLQPDH